MQSIFSGIIVLWVLIATHSSHAAESFLIPTDAADPISATATDIDIIASAKAPRTGGLVVSGGLSTVLVLPSLRFQVEGRIAPKSSVMFSVDPGFGGFYFIGTGNVDVRRYLTGSFNGGIYVSGGVQGGAAAEIIMAQTYRMAGPSVGFGGKLRAKHGFTTDIGLKLTAAMAFDDDPTVLPIPSAYVTFGRTSRQRNR